MVGQVHNDVERGTGFRTRVRAGCGVLRLRLSRVDGRIQMVGNRNLQAWMRLECLPIQGRT